MNNEFKLIEKYEQISELITANLKKGVRTNTAMSREEYEREISHGSLMAGETPQGLIILRNRPSHVKLNYYINNTDSSLELSELTEAVRTAGWNVSDEYCDNKCEQERQSQDKPIVMETAFRERDAALKETVEYLADCGFEEILNRVHLSNTACARDENSEAVSNVAYVEAANEEEENNKFEFYVKKSTAEDAAAIRPLLDSSFNPITGCLPENDELYADAAAGNILMLFADNDSRAASKDSPKNRIGAAVLQQTNDSRHPAAVPCGILHYRTSKKSAEIKHLAIAPQMRGNGLSSMLINTFLDECKDLKTTVWTGHGNAAALNAYKDCGFTEDGRRSSVMIYKK